MYYFLQHLEKMAAAVGRICKAGLLQSRNGIYLTQNNKLSTSSWTKGKKTLVTAIGALAGGAGALVLALDHSVKAFDLVLHPPHLPWSHKGYIDSFDYASVRRGYEVYKQVCAACHSMKFLRYRHLVGVIFSEDEAKKEAEEIMVTDGPDENGLMFQRPGRLTDGFTDPYPNEEAARAANGGALPPDLSYVTLARHGEEDYIFHLLTGYCDPPAGIELREGQYYNPYFTGGALSMAKALYDEIIEYSDGTPATTSQLAKDVSTFLAWSSMREHDERKQIALKSWFYFIPAFLFVVYWKRHVWSSIKTRKIVPHAPIKQVK